DPVLPAESLTAQLALTPVVVESQPAVVHEAREDRLLVAGISERLADGTVRQHLQGFGLDPGEECVEHRSGPLCALLAATLPRHVGSGFVDVIQSPYEADAATGPFLVGGHGLEEAPAAVRPAADLLALGVAIEKVVDGSRVGLEVALVAAEQLADGDL